MANIQLASWGTTFLAALADYKNALAGVKSLASEAKKAEGAGKLTRQQIIYQNLIFNEYAAAQRKVDKTLLTFKGTRSSLAGILNSSSTITTTNSNQILTSLDALMAKLFNESNFITWYNTYIKPLV